MAIGLTDRFGLGRCWWQAWSCDCRDAFDVT